ncbi:hypothetical protein OGH69_10900 [Flavobacterium sp. MFBS3-15]|uniref:hypothetical protein n=1 Tax=Flavobacterium sp. MFBS3-15 TaxID=2989816 RepID=UPI0022365337|nr:hypothetical protein [Flavobacterium sp. MFBS3-15]MCW4469475.1 hypothetical protein [Flavobacterium sp. MFBS3-15]
MKKTLLLAALAIAGVFTGCSDDNATTNNAQDTSLELVKTIKYIPTKEAYDNNVEGSKKNVQYFEGHKVVADTTFDISGNIAMRIAHTYATNTHISEIWVNESLWSKTTEIFDAESRIIESQNIFYASGTLNAGSSIKKYVYNTGSITQTPYDPDTNQPMTQYTQTIPVNSLGHIQYDGMIYQNDKLEQWDFVATEESSTVNFEYYGITMPANQLKTINELNNLFFISDDSRINITENNNYYLKRYVVTTTPTPSTSYITFENSFNDSGYITYSKAEGTIFENMRDSETFYYYE